MNSGMQTTVHPVFHQNADIRVEPTDLILVACDRTQFHVHRDHVTNSSTNSFAHLLTLPTDGELPLNEEASLVSLILHMIYNIPFNSQPPPLIVLASFAAFQKYGLPIQQYFAPPSQLLDIAKAHLLQQSREFAFELYARASQHDLLELAKAASTNLLSLNFTTVDNSQIMQITPTYLQKIYSLQTGRMQKFLQLLQTPPPAHSWTSTCGAEERQHFLGNWTIRAGEILVASPIPSESSFVTNSAPFFFLRPNSKATSSDVLRNELSTLEESISCEDCKTSLRARVDRIVHGWEHTTVNVPPSPSISTN